MGLYEGFFWGVLGGALAELLGWFRLRQREPEEFPGYAKTRTYWIVTIGMTLAGGVLVVAYLRSDIKVNSIVALNLGASAPLILGSLTNNAPPISVGKID